MAKDLMYLIIVIRQVIKIKIKIDVPLKKLIPHIKK